VEFLGLRGAFGKIKCIFSIALVVNLYNSEKHSPDAVRGGTERWPLASGVLSESGLSSRAHRTLYTGRRGSAVWASGGC